MVAIGQSSGCCRSILAIIEFKKIDNGPGPPLSIRISELEADEKIKKYGFIEMYCGEISEFNYLITFQKNS